MSTAWQDVQNKSADAHQETRSARVLGRLVGGVVMCGLLWSIAHPAHAQDWRDVVFQAEDPLLVRPPVLDQGMGLRGDELSPSCAVQPPEQVAQHTLSLFDILEIGMCVNPQIRSAWAGIKLQAGALGEARAAYLPTISGALSRVNDTTNYPNGDLTNTSVRGNAVSASLTWRLFDFGGRTAVNASAGALLEGAIATHSAAVQKTMFTLIGGYFDVQTTRAAFDAKQRARDLAARTVETAKRRESKGVGSQTDTLQAVTAFAKASLDSSRAQGDFEKALSTLVYNMGLPSNTHLQLEEDVDDDHHVVARDLDDWLEQAKVAHPAIIAAQKKLESDREKVIATESDGLPTIDLSANFYQNGRPNQGFPTVQTNENVVYLTLNIPIFEGFARTYKIRGAQAQVEQSQANLDDITHQTLMDVVKTYTDTKVALSNLAASELLLTSAQKSLDSVQRKFDRNASDILEMLSAQAALADAQAQRIRCLGEWRSAKLRLVASAGVLGRTNYAP